MAQHVDRLCLHAERACCKGEVKRCCLSAGSVFEPCHWALNVQQSLVVTVVIYGVYSDTFSSSDKAARRQVIGLLIVLTLREWEWL